MNWGELTTEGTEDTEVGSGKEFFPKYKIPNLCVHRVLCGEYSLFLC
jgi:hypothetical protein